MNPNITQSIYRRFGARRPKFLACPVRLLAGLALVSFAAAVAPAADFYVDADAPDGGAGTPASPWNSIAQVNGHAFNPGDNVHFQRGDTWTGAGLVVNQSGTSDSARITYGAYGTGNKPVFANLTGAGVTVANQDYITVQDLSISAPAGNGVSISNGNFVTILRLDVADNGSGPGINAAQGGNVLIDGCTVSNAKSNGIQFKGSPAPNQIHDSTIQNCVVLNTRANDGIVIHAATTFLETAGSNFVIRNNRSEGSFENGYDITTGSNILLEGNTSRNNEEGAFNLGHSARHVTVRYHWAEDEPTRDTAQTVKITVPDVLIEYCVLIGSAGRVKPVINIVNNGGLSNEPNPENVTIRNNTVIWNNPTSPGNFFSIGSGVAMQNLTLKNNLFVSRTPTGGTMNYGGVNPPGAPGYAIDHNLYHGSVAPNFRVGGTSYTFAVYQSTFGRDLAGLAADPQFVDAAAGDFHLQAGSPAINAGDATGLSGDFDGVPVPQGGARDLGAFEYTAAPVAPTDLTATASSPSQVDLAWTDSSADETAFRIQRKEAGGAYADTIPATVAANSTAFSDTADVAGGTTYTYRVRAESPAGESAWSNEASATTPEADTTAPEITALTATPDHLWPANHQMVAVTLTATATDDRDPAPVTKILSVTSSEAANGSGDGNTAVDWTITGDLTLNLRAERSGNGPGRLYTVTVESTDASGNSSTATVLIPVGHNNDTQPPTVALTAPTNGALVGGNVAVAATATDNDSVVGVQFKLDGANLGVEDSSAPYGLSWNTATASNGNHTLTAVARDENGNMATAAAVTVFVDNAPPAVAVTAPTAGSLLTGSGHVLSASATDNVAVAALQFKLDGVALGAELTAAPYELTWDSSTVADGAHTLTAVARDTIGNTATSAAIAVTTDNLPPSVAVIAPAANAIVGGAAVTLTATASDLIGVDGVQFQVDGIDVGAEDTTVPYAGTWDTTSVGNGAHTVTAIARDQVGHTAVSAPVTVTVDNTPPTVALTAPADGATVSGGSVAVAAEAADDIAVAGVQFQLDGVNLGAEDTTAPYGLTWNSMAAANGTRTLTAVARDAAGNTAASAPVSVTVSNVVLPPVTLEAELLPAVTSGPSLQIINNADASDGRYRLMNSNVPGQFITYTVNVPVTGTYQVSTGLATQGNRGIFQLLIDGVNQGVPQDYYTPGAVAQFSVRHLGAVTLGAGDHSFRFLLTGKNPAASNHKHALDYIVLTPQ